MAPMTDTAHDPDRTAATPPTADPLPGTADLGSDAFALSALRAVDHSGDDGLDPLPATRRALLHQVARAQADGRAPSVVAALVRGGRPRWFAARGEVAGSAPGPDTQYRIGSLTKTFVAVAVLRLRDEGLLSLDDRLDVHLPDVPQAGDATVAQLLSHTAGLAAETGAPWWERSPGELRPEPADLHGPTPRPHPPGRRFHYSNPGFATLGALIGAVRGRDWFDVLREEVLEPLGMRRTTQSPRAPHAAGWAVHPHADAVQPEPAVDTGLMAPAGQLWSTAADLARFADFLSRGDDRVLSAASLAEMRRPAAPPEGGHWIDGYGLGMQLLMLDGRLLAGHSGSMPGFVAGLWVHPEQDVATVVLANVTSGLRAATLAADLLTAVAEQEPALPAPWHPDPAPDRELLGLSGLWYWGPAATEVRVTTGRELRLGAPGAGRGSRFRPEADGSWTGQDGYLAGERLRVVRRPDGSVSHLDAGSFVFTRRPYEPGDPVPGGVDAAGWR